MSESLHLRRDEPVALAAVQAGVLAYSQAVELVGRARLRREIRAGRWLAPSRGVVVTHNGPLTAIQRAWTCVLRCPTGCALSGPTALELDGFQGFEMAVTHVTLPNGHRRPNVEGLVPHWSIHLSGADVHPVRSPRRTRPARSLVDFASWSPNPRYARAIILAGVQQRLARTRDLREALSRRGPCRHRGLIIESILDASGGIQSLPERDFDQIRLARHLPAPTRQAPRRRRDGRFYLDVEWCEYETACEIHGIPHLEVRQWDSDNFRGNEIAIAGPRQLIFSSFGVRHSPNLVGDQLERMLRRGGWQT